MNVLVEMFILIDTAEFNFLSRAVLIFLKYEFKVPRWLNFLNLWDLEFILKRNIDLYLLSGRGEIVLYFKS